jgi:diketogulonate reductase-like aldo/keto reductase
MTKDVNALIAPLRGGGGIPLLGFGTWQLEGAEAYEGTRAALDIGYRHIDTATGYSNEDRVGAALRDSGVERSEVFVTTKCPPERAGQELKTLEESLSALGADFVDLWLVHWPPNGQARPATWRQFIAAREAGKVRSIGVSNYSVAQIDELIEATGQSPAVNQIPWSPFLYDPATAADHDDRGIVLEGYSPLKRSNLGHPLLVELARSYGKTPAQIVLRWHLDHGFVVIPKSARRERIEENFDLGGFQLTEDEVARLDRVKGGGS